MITVTLFGAGGRMGRAVAAALAGESDIALAHAVEAPERAGGEVAGLPLEADDPRGAFEADVWVDVSLAAAACEHALRAEESGTPILIGATGFTARQSERLHRLGCAHLIAPNLSLGVNLLLALLPRIRRVLGTGYDAGIVETHHRHKRDAPSGTAKALAAALEAEGPEVQVRSLRLGEIVGEHCVRFAAEGEEIELVHRAHSRMAFARGVAPAVRFLAGKRSGGFSMADVLGL